MLEFNIYNLILGVILFFLASKLVPNYVRYLKIKSKYKILYDGKFITGSVGGMLKAFGNDTLWQGLMDAHKLGPIYYATTPFCSSADLNVQDPEIIELISGNTEKNSRDVDPLTPLIGFSLVTSNGSKWKTDRKKLLRAFSVSHTFAQLPYMTEPTEKWLQNFDEIAKNKEVFDIDSSLARISLEINSYLFFGKTVSKEDSETIIRLTTQNASETIKAIVFPLYFKYPITSGAKRALNDCTEVRKLVNNYIESAKKLDQNDKTILSILLNSKDDDGSPLFNHEELLDHGITFLLAGYDTTSHSTAWAVYELIKEDRSEIMGKLLNELDTVMEDSKIPNESQLKEMPYLDQVAKECLRIHGAVAATSRKQMHKDLKIKDLDLKKGDIVNVNIVALHHDPKLWPNPEHFDPERFSKENYQNTKNKFIPFGFGKRNCIGYTLAQMEMKFFLAILFKNYEITLKDKNVIHKLMVTHSPATGIMISLNPRNTQ